MSPAFLDALSMALRRAEFSQAWPSVRAYSTGSDVRYKVAIVATRGQREAHVAYPVDSIS